MPQVRHFGGPTAAGAARFVGTASCGVHLCVLYCIQMMQIFRQLKMHMASPNPTLTVLLAVQTRHCSMIDWRTERHCKCSQTPHPHPHRHTLCHDSCLHVI